MASIAFAQDDKPPVDNRLEEIATIAENSGKLLRVRVQPDLYDHGRTAYTTWSGLAWMLDCQDVAEAKRFREGLTNFMRVFGSDEKRQRALLVELARRAVGVKA